MNQEAIGSYIRQKRLEKSLTQEQLAEDLGVSKNTVSRWERGINIPDLSLLDTLASELDTSVKEIITGRDDISKKTADDQEIKKNDLLISYAILSIFGKMNEVIKKLYIALQIVIIVLLDLAYGFFGTKYYWETSGGIFDPRGIIFSAVFSSNGTYIDHSMLFSVMFKALFIVLVLAVILIMILVELKMRKNDIMLQLGNRIEE